jgi:penicillin-binding protein 2
VIDHIATSSGKVTYEFSPKVLDKLSLSDEHIRQIQEAMVGVIRNEDPRGTAWHRFTGLEIPVAGKTGTAQTASDRPHAWFAGYTFAEQEGRPDIAIAVLVENIGEGSDYAAPIFRRVVELYFMGQPQKLYWWETTFNVTATLPGFEASTPTGAPAGSAAGELVETPVP